jgi:hypothetical protein
MISQQSHITLQPDDYFTDLTESSTYDTQYDVQSACPECNEEEINAALARGKLNADQAFWLHENHISWRITVDESALEGRWQGIEDSLEIMAQEKGTEHGISCTPDLLADLFRAEHPKLIGVFRVYQFAVNELALLLARRAGFDKLVGLIDRRLSYLRGRLQDSGLDAVLLDRIDHIRAAVESDDVNICFMRIL